MTKKPDKNLIDIEKKPWTDVYMRSYFGDTGEYPRDGVLSHSPDIQPLGQNPIADPDVLISDQQWGVDQGQNIAVGLPNYIYLRGKNNGGGATEGRFYLYYSPATLLNWPVDPTDQNKGWSKNPLKTSNGDTFVRFTSGPDGRVVTSEPFSWIASAPPTGDHFCLIGRVTTPDHPNDLPQLGDIDNFAAWISDHPNMAWRNVTTINPQQPISSASVEYSQGEKGGETIILVKAVNAPIGSKISFSSGTPGPTPPIFKQPEVIDNETKYTTAVTTDVPAGYTTNIAISWYSEGKSPLPGMQITLEAVLPVNADHPLFSRGFDLREYGIPDDAMPRTLGAGPKRGIRLGSFSMANPGETGGLRFEEDEPATRGVTAPASLTLTDVRWMEARHGLFSTHYTTRSVGVARSNDDGIEIDTVKISDAQGRSDDPWQTTTSAFDTGSHSGEMIFVVKTTDVPRGCEIELIGSSGEVRIGRRTIDNSASYTATAYATLPEDFQTDLTCNLYLGGKSLPSSAQIQLSVLQTEESADGAPLPGKLLGRIVTRPGGQ